MSKITIFGAGLAGLIAAHKFKTATVFDEAPMPGQQHKALLRFRSTTVADLTGIPFRKVNVTKGVYYEGQVRSECTIPMANKYAIKVVGVLASGRSITNLAPTDRYIAPDDFYDQMVRRLRLEGRIFWSTSAEEMLNSGNMEGNVISTIPMKVMLKILGIPTVDLAVDGKKIIVHRLTLPEGTDLFQTIYFPEANLGHFRVSITGRALIIECVDNGIKDLPHNSLVDIARAFGIDFDLVKNLPIETTEQFMGKIVDLPRSQREAILYELTRDHNVFSVGRFATHRNILLDDVVSDLDRVERLMSASDYHRSMQSANATD